ncbi:MAG: alpha/beta hydrolase [Chitinophagales bacterium]|nr:alpha/beta hydrolase [Chitinophagales bacterium]MDW8273798.1 alpha/beta hydrolase [Chitinophagales bacterium]
MKLEIKQDGNFRYCEAGEGPVILLLHGLFGALSNFTQVIEYFSKNHKVVIPLLPLYELELEKSTVTGMVEHLAEFVDTKGYKDLNLIGNSLGGHIAIIYTLQHPEKVKTITLTGSSGLFENSLGDTYPRKGDYEFVKKKTQDTFYDPNMATKELVDEVFEIVNNRDKALRVVLIAKSAVRHNLRDELHKIKVPVNLIWGKNDTITPPFVAEEFHKLLPISEVHYIDKCGHAAMMERPEEFNACTQQFLTKYLR